jgi:poly(A)-specific ribonuclease
MQAAVSESINVDVTRENFQATLPAVKEALDRCTFFAFDCEMTGLFLDTTKHEYLDDMHDR